MKGWKGVRPVRFREELFQVLDFIVKNERVPIEKIREYAVELRLKREDSRLKASQTYVSLKNIKGQRPRLLTKVEQMVRVYRRTGLIKKEGNIIRSTAKSNDLISLRQRDETGSDALFLEFIINSPYQTYWLFLRQLWKSNHIKIPKSRSKRDYKLREFINKKGFLLDVWSFFILRDFFQDFSVLNYIIDESFQVIFPLYEIEDKISDSSSFQYHIRGPDGYLSFWPKTPQDFSEKLIDVYLSLTDNKWNRMVDIVTLREQYSIRYTTPERLFDLLFKQALKNEKKYRIFPSVGHIKFSPRSTYMTKALTLPSNKSGFPYTLVRIDLGR